MSPKLHFFVVTCNGVRIVDLGDLFVLIFLRPTDSFSNGCDENGAYCAVDDCPEQDVEVLCEADNVSGCSVDHTQC